MAAGLLCERLRELVPALRTRAAEAEQARCVPAESIAELAAAGMFRAYVPRRFGGDERDILDVSGGVIDLAQGCASTAWVASLLATHSVIAAWFDPRAQETLWASGPDTRIASSVAPVGTVVRTDEGYRLTGRWSFVSGVDHSSWLMLGSLAPDESSPERTPRNTLFLVPTSACTIDDDWDVAGLRATGSKSVRVTDVVVPHHHALPLHTTNTTPGQLSHESPLYRVPWKPLFNSAFPPIALGIALANLDAFRDHVAARVNAFSGQAARQNAAPSIRLAEAAAQVDAASQLFHRDATMLAASASSMLRPLPADAQARITYNAAFVIDACSNAVNQLWRGSGGKALYQSNVMQRCFRDIYAMTQHGAFDMDICGEAYGKELLATPTFGARW